MAESEDSTTCNIHLRDLRKWDIFDEGTDALLREVKSFYAFNVQPQNGCKGGAGIVFITKSGAVYGQGHNCRKVNILGFPKSQSSYMSEYIPNPVKIQGLSYVGIKQISIGGVVAAAVSDCGTLYWWGICTHVEDDVVTPYSPRCGTRKYLYVSCGRRLVAALAHSKDVFVWGRLEQGAGKFFHGERVVVDSHISQISCGLQHLTMLDNNGHVYTWGRGDQGQRGLENYTAKYDYQVTRILEEPCIQIKCGPYSTFCLTARSQLKACGSNGDYHLGHLTRLRKGNTVSTLTEIYLFGIVKDFSVVWNEDFTASMAAQIIDDDVTELVTWGAGLSPYPKYSGINSFYDFFTTLKFTPGLVTVRFSNPPDENELTARKNEVRSKIVSDALISIFFKDRPITRQVSRKTRKQHIIQMANLIPCDETGKQLIMNKFVSDLQYKPQIAPRSDNLD